MNSFKRVRVFQIELEFESVGFWGEGKTVVPGENLSEQRREPTTYSTHIWRQLRELNRATLVGGERSHHWATLALRKIYTMLLSLLDNITSLSALA